MRQLQGLLQLSAFVAVLTAWQARSCPAGFSWLGSLPQSLLPGAVPLHLLQLSASPSVLAAQFGLSEPY